MVTKFKSVERTHLMQTRPDVPLPGDYWQRVRDGSALVVLCCPGCGVIADLGDHTIHNLDPLTVEPSVACDSGCHYFIANGVVRYV